MKRQKLFIYGIDGAQANYVKEWTKLGKLPNFKKLMDRGVFWGDCYSVFPTISPTCWNSIFTGALPKVHGGVDDVMIDKTTPPWEQLTSYCGDLIKAERFWETASKVGVKTLLLDVLASGPRKEDNVTQVMGHQTVTPNNDYVSGIPGQYYTLKKDGYRSATTKGVGVAKFDENCIKLSDDTYKVKAVKGDKPFNASEIEDFSWVIEVSDDGIRIGDSESSARECPIVKKGCWSKVLTRNLSTLNTIAPFHFRAYLEEVGEDYVVVYINESRNLVKEIVPESDRLWIEKIPEIHKTSDGDFYLNPDKFYDTAHFVREWKRKVIKEALHRDYDVIFDYEILIDTTNHYELGVYEGVGVSDTITRERAKKDIERAYKFVDEQIGWIIDNVIDDDVTFCVVSDHGGVGPEVEFRFFEALNEEGLITYVQDDKSTHTHKNLNVDWSKTLAYPAGGSHINVNLKGREPTGIVDVEDYDEVVHKIIRALQKHTVTKDGKTRGLAFAVPGDQAGFIGLGGGYTGDVVYGIIGSKLGGYFGGVHAEQIPSGKTKTGGDMRPVCIISGKRFKEGEVIDRPTDLTDVAPTLCYAMDYPQPKDATGGVVFQALKEDR